VFNTDVDGETTLCAKGRIYASRAGEAVQKDDGELEHKRSEYKPRCQCQCQHQSWICTAHSRRRRFNADPE